MADTSNLININSMEKTLVILKPCTIQRGLIGEIISRFERKGLQLGRHENDLADR